MENRIYIRPKEKNDKEKEATKGEDDPILKQLKKLKTMSPFGNLY